MTQFKNKQEAIAAGYQSVNRNTDKDISGPNSFGHKYRRDDGAVTVTVWLEQEQNKIGRKGAFIPMYPPQ